MPIVVLLSFGSEKKDWIKHSWKPRSISCLTILIREFLKRWGPKAQSLEETIQDLENAFSREGFVLEPIDGLREMLLPNFVEITVEIQ